MFGYKPSVVEVKSVDSYVWIKFDKIQDIKRIRDELTLYPRILKGVPQKEEGYEPIRLYKERVNEDGELEIGVPWGWWEEVFGKRYSIGSLGWPYGYIGFPVDRLRFHGDVVFKGKFEGRFIEQGDVVKGVSDYLVDMVLRRGYAGGIIEAAPGTGKTVMGLAIAVKLGVKTAILLHKEFLINQWRERIESFIGGADVGIIKASKREWEGKDIVLVSIQSVVEDLKRIERGERSKYGEGFYDYFGLVVTDECHRIGAPTWSKAITAFSAPIRLGLSATLRRADGMEKVFWYHIGPVIRKLRKDSLKVRVFFKPFTGKYHVDKGKVLITNSRGAVYAIDESRANNAQLLGAIEAKRRERAYAIVNEIEKGLIKGRKVIVLGDRLNILRAVEDELKQRTSAGLLEKIPGSDREGYQLIGWYIGGMKRSELKKSERAQVLLVTVKMAAEGLDIPALDTIVLITPMSDVEQAVGRIRRACVPGERRPGECEHFCPWKAHCEGKPMPVVIDMVDTDLEWARKRKERREGYYKKVGFEIYNLKE